jgi:hypothetical protein
MISGVPLVWNEIRGTPILLAIVNKAPEHHHA